MILYAIFHIFETIQFFVRKKLEFKLFTDNIPLQ